METAPISDYIPDFDTVSRNLDFDAFITTAHRRYQTLITISRPRPAHSLDNYFAGFPNYVGRFDPDLEIWDTNWSSAQTNGNDSTHQRFFSSSPDQEVPFHKPH